MLLPPKPPNLKRLGAYENFNTLPLDEADVWLYTSAWDGVPQMLLEVAMTGVPLVGSLVGGTAEVLLDGMATGIAGENAADYVAALRAVLADPRAARARALKLRLALLDRTEAAYLEKVRALVAQCQPAPFNPG